MAKMSTSGIKRKSTRNASIEARVRIAELNGSTGEEEDAFENEPIASDRSNSDGDQEVNSETGCGKFYPLIY